MPLSDGKGVRSFRICRLKRGRPAHTLVAINVATSGQGEPWRQTRILAHQATSPQKELLHARDAMGTIAWSSGQVMRDTMSIEMTIMSYKLWAC